MRIVLSLVVLLSGLLVARELMLGSNPSLRLTLRGAKIVAEQTITALNDLPPFAAPVPVGPIGEVSAQTIASRDGPPSLAMRVAVAPRISLCSTNRRSWPQEQRFQR